MEMTLQVAMEIPPRTHFHKKKCFVMQIAQALFAKEISD